MPDTVLGSGDTLLNSESSVNANWRKVWFDTKGEPETKSLPPASGNLREVPSSHTVMCDVEKLSGLGQAGVSMRPFTHLKHVV